jgi:2-polyprenyl-6-hydroxyphenyl methylase / 3-demethylubiquinone-9 3-methyltransferase
MCLTFIGTEGNGIKVLDVGCGGGYTCEFLARRQAVVFGADILEESLGVARSHAMQENLKIEYRLCTPQRLPFDDHTMDVVTCFDVLEHIPGKDQTLCEIFRVLKPGGWLFFDTFNKTFWSKLFIIWFGEIVLRFIPRQTHHWDLFIRPEDLKLLLDTSGFEKMEIAGTKFDWHRRTKGEFPAKISSKKNTAIIYFGATRKPTSFKVQGAKPRDDNPGQRDVG